MKRKNFTKALSMFIALAMCLSLFSVPVFANDEIEAEDLGEEVTLLENNVTFELNPIFTTDYSLTTNQSNIALQELKWDLTTTELATGDNKKIIRKYDDKGYEITRKYDVTYTDENGEAQSGSDISYSEMAAIRDNAAYSDFAATKKAFTSVYTEVIAGRPFFRSSHSISMTGGALDGVAHVLGSRSWCEGRAAADMFYDINIGDETVTAAQQLTNFKNYMKSSDGWTYSITPDTDSTIYIAMPKNNDNALKNRLIGEGYTRIDSSGLSAASLPKEAFLEIYQKWFDEDGNWTLVDGATGAAVAKSFYMCDPSYNPENYPYFLNKIQYDGHDTVIVNYSYMYYKEVSAGTTVQIPTPAYQSQDALKVLVRFGAHLSDDVTGKLKIGGLTQDLTSREDAEIEVNAIADVSFEPNDSSVSYAFYDDAECSGEGSSSIEANGVSRNVYLKITAPAGNDVVYTLKINTVTPSITNIVSKDSAITSAGAKKIVDANVHGLNATSQVGFSEANNGADWEAEAKAAQAVHQAAINNANAALLAEYGSNAALGSSIWAGYPRAANNAMTDANKVVIIRTVYLDNPMVFNEAKTTNIEGAFVNGRGYVFKATKGGNPTETNPGVFGKDANWLTFDINYPGTMYLIDTNGKGYKGATDEGYVKIDARIAGCDKIYMKHFDAGTVNAPAQDIQGVTFDGTRIPNTPGFVFVFDDLSTAELLNVSYTIDGKTMTADADSDTIAVEMYDYTGDVTVSGNAEGSGSASSSVISLTNGNGSGTVTVTSADGSASKDYTVVFECTKYKIINPTKGTGKPWYNNADTGIYGNGTAALGETYAVVDGFIPGTTQKYSDRTNAKSSGSANLNGATYIRTPKNEAPAGTSDIRVYNSEGGKDNVSFTRQVGDNEPVIMTSSYNGAPTEFTVNGVKEPGVAFRKVSAGSCSRPFFSGAYDGTDGNWWATFVPTSDCTVILSDGVWYGGHAGGWPNLDKELWRKDRNYALNGQANNTYVRHYKAGEVVEIPNYGLSGEMLDTTPVVYTYYDSTGTQQTYTTTVRDDILNWDDITIAVVWDDKAVDSDAEYIKIDDTLIDGFKASVYEYTYQIPAGKDSVTLTAAAADDIAEITGASGTYSAGDVATIEITAGNGTTKSVYKVTFTPAAGRDATLKSISVGGAAIADFAADKTSYNVSLPYGSEIPEVTYEKNDAKATAEGNLVGNEYVIDVTAEDGTTKVQYKVIFSFEAKKVIFSASALSGTIKATYGSVTDENWETSYTNTFDVGTLITLKAEAADGAVFLYWKDSATSRVVSYTTEYSLAVGTDKAVIAVFKPADAAYKVKFTDMNYKILYEGYASEDIIVPADPYILGYTFEGWILNGALTDYKAGGIIPKDTITADAEFIAKQKLDETTYTVTFIGADQKSGEYRYNQGFGATYTVPEGKKFSHWLRDGVVVGYGEKYIFYVGNYNTTVEAVFVDDTGETPAAGAVVTMAEPTVVAGNKISFIMERSVPAGYKVVEAGILLKNGAVSEITLDNYDHKATSVNVADYGAYTIRKANVSAGETWSAVGYLIYTDGTNTYTQYSSVVSKTL